MAEKKKFPTLVTPLGIAKYAWLNKPDTKFSQKPEGEFKVRILIEDNEQGRAFCDKVIEAGKAFAKETDVKLKKTFHSPFIFPEDVDEDDFLPEEGKEKPKYDEDYRGKIFFDAKSVFKPGLIDAKKVELPENVYPMPGDKIKVKIAVSPYDGLGSGIALKLNVVQLIEKNTSFSGKPNTDGFDEEDGYEAPHREEGEEEF